MDNGKTITPDINPTLYKKLEQLLKVKSEQSPIQEPASASKKITTHTSSTKLNRSKKMQEIMEIADVYQKQQKMSRMEARRYAKIHWVSRQKHIKKNSTKTLFPPSATEQKNTKPTEMIDYKKPIKPKRVSNEKRCSVCGEITTGRDDICQICQDGFDSFNKTEVN